MSVIRFSLIVVSFVALIAMSQSQERHFRNTPYGSYLLAKDISQVSWRRTWTGLLGREEHRLAAGQAPEAKSTCWLESRAILYRAVLADEANHPDECKQKYQQALTFRGSAQAQPPGTGLAAITGGTNLLFADRAKEYMRRHGPRPILRIRRSGSSRTDYRRAPAALQGESRRPGKSALKTGHKQKRPNNLDKMIEVLKDTPYAAGAKALKEDPGAVEKTNVACLSCHDQGGSGRGWRVGEEVNSRAVE